MTLTGCELTTEALSRMSPDALVEHLLAYKERYETLNEEYDEYKSSSMEMEQMLEKELAEAQKARRNAEGERDGMKREMERTAARVDADKRESCAIEERLRTELAATRAALEAARVRVRALEQANDDLERKDRYQEQMLEDLTKNLETTIERATLLESELAETHFQAESATRTRDELRPMEHQLQHRMMVAPQPRVAVVDPLRMERAPEHTPEDTPEEERKAFAALHIDDSMEVDDAHPSTSSMDCMQQLQQLPPTPVSMAAAAAESDSASAAGASTSNEGEAKPRRAFTHSINKIVKDLLVRVDRVENVLMNLKSGGNHPSSAPPPAGH